LFAGQSMLNIGNRTAGVLIPYLVDFPGGAGVFLRRILWGKLFGEIDRGTSIPIGCIFDAPENIYFLNQVSIGIRSSFFASGGSIKVGAETAFNMNVHINASVGGAIRIGSQCLIGPNVVMRTANHNYSVRGIPIREQGHQIRDIDIHDDCWVGANATILGGVTVGNGAVVGAGSVVTKSVSPYSIVGGVPARLIKYREEEESHQ